MAISEQTAEGKARVVETEPDIIGTGLDACRERVRQFAKKGLRVLLVGNSGTGKELLAETYAANWNRGNPQHTRRSYVAINCTGYSEELLRSELFGYVAGAFTGALITGRQGLVYHNDLIFLDELGDVPKTMQAQLLRVVEYKDYSRVGGETLERTNAEFIAGTNNPGGLRPDLAYRFHRIDVPPLVERPQDIVALVERWSDELSVAQVTKDFVEWAVGHKWPGNVRELRQCLEVASLDGTLHVPTWQRTPRDKTIPIRRFAQKFDEARQQALEQQYSRFGPTSRPIVDEFPPPGEREELEQGLRDTNGNVKKLAAQRGINRTTLDSKLRKLGLDPKSFRGRPKK